MFVQRRFATLVLFVGVTLSGCAPKETFSWIDRNCFVADWTNHHSCLSCCRNGPCGQVYPNVQYPMLVLGNTAQDERIDLDTLPAGSVAPAESSRKVLENTTIPPQESGLPPK